MELVEVHYVFLEGELKFSTIVKEHAREYMDWVYKKTEKLCETESKMEQPTDHR